LRYDAELLAEAAHEGASDGGPLEEALVEYYRRRDEVAVPDTHENLRATQLRPRWGLILRDKPADTTRSALATPDGCGVGQDALICSRTVPGRDGATVTNLRQDSTASLNLTRRFDTASAASLF
jgi:hypothetical protein